MAVSPLNRDKAKEIERRLLAVAEKIFSARGSLPVLDPHQHSHAWLAWYHWRREMGLTVGPMKRLSRWCVPTTYPPSSLEEFEQNWQQAEHEGERIWSTAALEPVGGRPKPRSDEDKAYVRRRAAEFKDHLRGKLQKDRKLFSGKQPWRARLTEEIEEEHRETGEVDFEPPPAKQRAGQSPVGAAIMRSGIMQEEAE